MISRLTSEKIGLSSMGMFVLSKIYFCKLNVPRLIIILLILAKEFILTVCFLIFYKCQILFLFLYVILRCLEHF